MVGFDIPNKEQFTLVPSTNVHQFITELCNM